MWLQNHVQLIFDSVEEGGTIFFISSTGYCMMTYINTAFYVNILDVGSRSS